MAQTFAILGAMSRLSPRARGVLHLVLSTVLLTALACHPRAGSRSAFTRVDSPHFVLYGQLSSEQLEQHARKLETLLAGMLGYAWQGREGLPLRINVMMLPDAKLLTELARDRVGGYMANPLLFEPWIIMPTPDSEHDFGTACHELTHALAAQVMPYQPRWFAEGIAMFYETTRIRSGQLVIGEAPLSALYELNALDLTPPDQLFDPRADPLEGTFYSTSWLLVHYLMAKRTDAFVAYQRALARGQTHEDAWQKAFPDLHGSAIETALKTYLYRARFDYFTAEAPQVDVALATRTLTCRRGGAVGHDLGVGVGRWEGHRSQA